MTVLRRRSHSTHTIARYVGQQPLTAVTVSDLATYLQNGQHPYKIPLPADWWREEHNNNTWFAEVEGTIKEETDNCVKIMVTCTNDKGVRDRCICGLSRQQMLMALRNLQRVLAHDSSSSGLDAIFQPQPQQAQQTHLSSALLYDATLAAQTVSIVQEEEGTP